VHWEYPPTWRRPWSHLLARSDASRFLLLHRRFLFLRHRCVILFCSVGVELLSQALRVRSTTAGLTAREANTYIGGAVHSLRLFAPSIASRGLVCIGSPPSRPKLTSCFTAPWPSAWSEGATCSCPHTLTHMQWWRARSSRRCGERPGLCSLRRAAACHAFLHFCCGCVCVCVRQAACSILSFILTPVLNLPLVVCTLFASGSGQDGQGSAWLA
jgi:hypothetical protein